MVEGVGYFLARRKDPDTGQWVRDIPTWAAFVVADITANNFFDSTGNRHEQPA
ncbi:MAG TPA: hypothetical protein VFA40_22325 [Terriglobales bacterium]|nr:hypothetical protein [Terriglobales bacterium]